MNQSANLLQIQIPAPLGHIIRVADPVAEPGTAATNVTNLSHLDETPDNVYFRQFSIGAGRQKNECNTMLNRGPAVASQSNKIKPELVEIAERIGLSIRQLRSSLGTVEPTEVFEAKRNGETQLQETQQETQEDLEQQLRECFDRTSYRARDVQANNVPQPGLSPASSLERIHDRVIDGIVDQLLHDWDRHSLGAPGAIEDEIVERLIARILERLDS